MRTRKWIVAFVISGLLLSFGSCASDLGYYLIDTLADSLPDILESMTNTTTA